MKKRFEEVLNRFKKAAMTAAAYHLTEEEQKELRRVFERLDEARSGPEDPKNRREDPTYSPLET